MKPAKSLLAYTNVVVETMGEAIVEVEAFGLVRKVKVTVVAKHDTPLFGLDWCMKFGVQMPQGVKIGSLKDVAISKEKFDSGVQVLDSRVQALITEFAETNLPQLLDIRQ